MHDSWAYFGERFGLQIVAAAEPHPGIPPSPAELAALFTRMREAGVRVLIADPHANPALVRQIAEKGGATSVTLFPSGPDYIALFEENVKRLAETLKQIEGLMIELLLWPLVAGFVLAGIHASGMHVLARGVVFVDLSLAQVAALGLTIAILAGHSVQSEAGYW